MSPSLARLAGAGLERSCGPDEWIEADELADGIELIRARFRGRPFSRHRHDVYAIGITEEGCQAFEYRGALERSVPGAVFVLHPDERHDGRAEGDDAFAYRELYVDPGTIAAALRAITGRATALPFLPAVSRNPPLAGAIRAAFLAAGEELARDALAVHLAGAMLPWITPSRSCGRADLLAVERGRELLTSRMDVIRSTDLEAATGLDRYEFARQFRLVHGTSPYRYSVMRRVEAARRRLRDGAPLVQTALDFGFADQAHFTRVFKSTVGLTPGRYARLAPTVDRP